VTSLRVLWVNHRDPRHKRAGGAEDYLWQILKRLPSPGFSHTLLCEASEGLPAEELVGNIRIVRRGGSWTLHLRAPLWREPFDVCVESVAHAVPFFTGMRAGTPCIILLYHVHQDVVATELPPLQAKFVRFMERTVRFRRARFIAISDYTRSRTIDRLGVKGSVEVIPPGVDTSDFTPTLKAEPPFFIYLGGLKSYKRVDHIIEAYKMARGNSRLIIAGDGYLAGKLKESAKGIGDIEFLGRVSEESKRVLLGQAAANVIASSIEGYSLTALEAAAAGTPTIAYSVGPLAEVIVDGVTGRLVSNGCIEDLSEAMKDALSHPEWGQLARKRVELQTWDLAASHFARVIRDSVDSWKE